MKKVLVVGAAVTLAVLVISWFRSLRAFSRRLSRPSGIQIRTLLLAVLITSCRGLHQTNESVHEPKTGTAALPAERLPLGDPQFVESRDIVSIRGPLSITRGVLRDRQGNLWFATWEGIVRYDGKYFTNLTLLKGLRRFHVFSILEDRRGNLWFGTVRGGVYRYDGEFFTLFTVTDGLASNVVSCMAEDQAGNIWFGTDHGVSRYDGRSFTNFTIQDGLSGNAVNVIVRDQAGKLWFGTSGGVSWFDSSPAHRSGGRPFTEFTNTPGSTLFSGVQSIIEGKNGFIWIGSRQGLWRYDGKSLTKLRTKPTSHIFEDQAGNLWLSESDPARSVMTLSRYDGRSFTEIATSAQIFAIAEDRTGTIWFGTEQGVSRYDGRVLTRSSDELRWGLLR
ncbi:MAG: two-component regulator propeller domain-containing protein [Acidobacteriota bacterium]